MKIVPLIEREQDIETAARWTWEEWKDLSGLTLDQARLQLIGRPDCPPSLLAIDDTEAVGVLAFRRVMYKGREPMILSINALYVDARARGRGVGTALVAEAVERAAAFVRVVHVYTNLRAWYEARGFAFLEDDAGTPNCLLCRTLP